MCASRDSRPGSLIESGRLLEVVLIVFLAVGVLQSDPHRRRAMHLDCFSIQAMDCQRIFSQICVLVVRQDLWSLMTPPTAGAGPKALHGIWFVADAFKVVVELVIVELKRNWDWANSIFEALLTYGLDFMVSVWQEPNGKDHMVYPFASHGSGRLRR